MAEAAMLGDLIRLADYMAVSCCYLLVIQVAATLVRVRVRDWMTRTG